MDWSLFKRAVADSEEPTAGYMYREMAQWTFKDYNAQMKFIGALFEKLRPSASAHVLYKVLRIIKVMCETGHSDFQKEMQKTNRTEEIKAYAVFRGVPDVRHGDSLNEKVRQAARDAMEAIFTHRKEDRLSIETGYGNNANRSGGTVGQTTFTTGNVLAGAGVGGPMGVYSNHIAPMPITNKWAEHMAQQVAAANTSTASRMLSTVVEKAKVGLGMIQTSEAGKRYMNAKDQLYESALRLSTTGAMAASLSSMTDTGSFQPVELSLDVPFAPPGGTNSSSGWKFIEEIEKNGDTATHKTISGSSVLQMQQQPLQLTPLQECVQRLCQMKNTPQRVELHAFVTQCLNIGAEIMPQQGVEGDESEDEEDGCWEELAESLDAQLAQKHPWQRRLNALVALEALLLARADAHNIDAAVTGAMQKKVMRYFLENPEDVERNVVVVQATLRERAQRVAKLLGLPEHDACSKAAGQGTCSAFVPNSEAQQTQCAGNAMHTVSWSAPLPTATVTADGSGGGGGGVGRDAAVDLSGMTLRRNPRGVRDKTTLKKRAPMRLAEEEGDDDDRNYNPASNNNTSSSSSSVKNNIVNDNSRHRGPQGIPASGNHFSSLGFPTTAATTMTTMTETANMGGTNVVVGNNSVLDDLFGGPSPSPSVTAQSNNSNTTAFDFFAVNNGGDHAPFAPLPTQEAFAPYTAASSMQVSPPSLFCATPSMETSNDNGNNNIVGPGGGNFQVLSPQTSAAAMAGSYPTMLMQLQQQLQSLMADLQRNPSSAALEQLQSLMAQQQQLMALLPQQQQQQPQQQQQMLWSNPSFTSVSASDANRIPLHNHFATGATPSFPSGNLTSTSTTTSSSLAPNAFAEMQKEMLTRMTGTKPKDGGLNEPTHAEK